ncbi:GTP cyclohydrolase II RibA [Martelella lutilitoris]|uniref:GTP cyclohydrolase-2 n=1 Tax=Martelella lutilitoris TaxID=2583532 RepID=A0A5C4JWB4_9HYPH|nr:GTP cyclohydrolase II RibA [Martelella lutilitoris]TNB49655.1 GTP cyclohydrolase II RibA [Martelella lutilitoris]
MRQDKSFDFATLTPEAEVERAVAELRFGRPVIMREVGRRIAALALDCVAPALFDQFARAAENRHSLFLTRERADRLGIRADGGIAVPLAGIGFDEASRLAYALSSEKPAAWTDADPLAAASQELARLALLLPAMVTSEIAPEDGRFAACQEIDFATLDQSEGARQNFQQVVRTRVPLKEIGDADFAVFRGGLAQKDQIAIIVGKPDLGAPVPVRIHSSCITGDLSGSLKCDCGDQLRNGLKQLKAAGGGVLVYLDQEGRGTGIGAKMRAYGYQHQGLDTIDADAELGLASDHRRYEAAAAMLSLLGISSVVLHTNNPTKIDGLRANGIDVSGHVRVTGTVTTDNVNYLRTKTLRAGHTLELESLIAAE